MKMTITVIAETDRDNKNLSSKPQVEFDGRNVEPVHVIAVAVTAIRAIILFAHDIGKRMGDPAMPLALFNHLFSIDLNTDSIDMRGRCDRENG